MQVDVRVHMQVDDAGGNHECSWTWASPGSGAIRTASSALYTELSDGWSTSSWRRVVHIKAAISITYTEPVRLAYQPPVSSTFLSEQISHQQPASSTLLSEQTSTSHQPPANRTG
jgi:hypothetical protein